MRGMWGSKVYILLVLGAVGRIHYSLCSVQLSQLQFLLQGLGDAKWLGSIHLSSRSSHDAQPFFSGGKDQPE